MVSEAKYKTTTKTSSKRLKILTHMLQRLPIALAQVKAGNNSKNLYIKWNQTNCLFFVSVKRKQ